MNHTGKFTASTVSSLIFAFGSFSGLAQPAGGLDLTFGTDGIVIHDVTGNAEGAVDVVLQSDGKILVAAKSTNGILTEFSLLRYNSDGSVDNTFDTDGYVDVSMTNFDYPNAIAVQSDGKILIVGSTELSPFSGDMSLAVVRFNTDGSLDNAFDGDGRLIIDDPTYSLFGHDIVLQTDGKIVVAASGTTSSEGDLWTFRFNTDGSYDNTFDADGVSVVNWGPNSENAGSLCLQSDGKIVVVGTNVTDFTTSFDVIVQRLNTDGSLDNTFDSDGMVQTDVNLDADYGTAVMMQPDGKILVGAPVTISTDLDAGVLRYNTDGSLDITFDTDGIAVSDLFLASQGVYDIDLQADGKIVVAGRHADLGTGDDFMLSRFNADGSTDITFNTDGIATTDITTASEDDVINAICIQPDGKILGVGYTRDAGSVERIGLARYLDTAIQVAGFEDESAFVGLTLYPNPSLGTVYFLVPGANVQYAIFDQTGRKVSEGKAEESWTLNFNVAGLYSIVCTDGENIWRNPFVVR